MSVLVLHEPYMETKQERLESRGIEKIAMKVSEASQPAPSNTLLIA